MSHTKTACVAHGGMPVLRRGLTAQAVCTRCGVTFKIEKYRTGVAQWCSHACRYPPELERFEANINRTDGCWNWTGFIDDKGYGQFGRTTAAYRYAYELWVGPIPAGLELDHLCRNPCCVRPDHLEPVTHAENMRRAMVTHCTRGHPYDKANTWVGASGRRNCRACSRENARRYASKSTS